MEKQNVKVEVTGDTKQLVILTGQAPKVQEPVQLVIVGNIDAVSRYLKTNRPKTDTAVILVDRQDMSINFTADENSPLGTDITGKMILNPDLIQFGINSCTTNNPVNFTKHELISLLKRTRMFFPDKESHAALMSQLKNLVVRTISETKNQNDNQRGKTENVRIVDATTEIDLGFKLSLPLFKGQPASTFFVDICFDASDHSVEFYLESAELFEALDSAKKTAIDTEVSQFTGYLVIEQ